MDTTNPDIAIEVKNVTKYFKSRNENTKIGDYLVYHKKSTKKINSVLNNINFTVKKGESIALIGHNGCGKSTMLKLLSKILRPNEGEITTNGKISCLIELGAGFHPDMTGIENIYINASIFGVSTETVNQRLDKIIEFSEIGDRVYERVRNYSSGMYLRLAFSVAINVDAEILLIDEILAVGDAHFQKKCLDKIKEFKNNGGTIVLVTHNLEQVKEICDRAIWIDNGSIREMGDPTKVCDHYEEVMSN